MKKAMALFLAALLMLSCIPALGHSSFSRTPLGPDGDNTRRNISLVCEKLDGWVLLSGETFSFNDAVGPRTEENGYAIAVNGRGVKVRGGGVAQAATALYLAVREKDGVRIDEMRSYGSKFTGGYVDDPADAVLVDYSAGTDFVFTNRGETLTIRMWIDGDSLYCSAQGDAGAQTLLSSAQTWTGSAGARRSNIALAAQSIDGTVIDPGEEFSFNDVVGPRTAECGYAVAINGRGVKVRGGGVAQAASTLYLALKDLPEILVTNKRTYGDRYNQSYVSDPDDAIVTDYAAGTDFCFVNAGERPVRIGMTIDQSGFLRCSLTALEDVSLWEDEFPFDDEFFFADDPYFEDDFFFEDETGDLFAQDGRWTLDENGEWVWESAWEWLE